MAFVVFEMRSVFTFNSGRAKLIVFGVGGMENEISMSLWLHINPTVTLGSMHLERMRCTWK